MPGPDEGRQRKMVSLELTLELEEFLQQHPFSSWAPDLQFQLGKACQLRSSYSKAIRYYTRAWDATKDSDQFPARKIALDSAGPLAKLLALTGRLEELDALQLEARARGKVPPSSDWLWASEMAAFARKHPTDSYKCGLYCLDQLGRLTQPDKYRPADVLETESSVKGFTAADLIAVGQKAGLAVHAVQLEDFSELPVPCVVHLIADHFVVVRERRGDFYEVLDPVAYGPRWLIAAELAEEASGCLLLS
ncbi:MAG TPA: cysteine peptidase family C39 domain-containing protein [Haliangiales bacterium]|nr:cysteine peptidase family C39 domain-containing protein [Haliangiales bacterium]